MPNIERAELDQLLANHRRWTERYLRSQDNWTRSIVRKSEDRLKLTNCSISGIELSKENLLHSEFNACTFTHVSFVGCNFMKGQFIQCQLNNCKFKDCRFPEARWHYCNSLNLNFSDCALIENYILGCRFLETDFNNSNLDWGRYNETDLRFSKYDGVTITGIHMQTMKLFTPHILLFLEDNHPVKARFENIDMSSDGDGSLILSDEQFRELYIKGKD